MVDEQLWELSHGNPIAMLDMIDLARYKELAKDEAFIGKMDEVYTKFNKYMSLKGKLPALRSLTSVWSTDWTLRLKSIPEVWGILAGDYLKEAQRYECKDDRNGFSFTNTVYFTQQLSGQGDQVAVYDPQDFSKTPVNPRSSTGDGKWLTTSVAFPEKNHKGKDMACRCVRRVELYLLDSDIDENLPEDRGVIPISFTAAIGRTV